MRRRGADADRGAVSRIRRAAAQYRRRLRAPSRRRGRPGAAARRRLPRPHRPAARRAGQLPALRRRRRAACRWPTRWPARSSWPSPAWRSGAGARIRLAAVLDPAALPAASPRGSPRRSRPASIRSPARCSRAAAAGSARWCWKTAPSPPIPPRPPPPWPPRSIDRVADLDRRGAAVAGAGRADARRWSRTAAGPTCPTRRSPPTAAWLADHLHGVTRLADAQQARSARRAARALGLGARQPAGPRPADASGPAGRPRGGRLPPAGAGGRGARAAFLRPCRNAAARRRPGRCGSALLSPAGRPVAITGDLAGFWRGAWADVRKDMRGRYPQPPLARRSGHRQRAPAVSARKHECGGGR